jgi:hypothetical protein
MERLGNEHRAVANSNVPIWLITGLSRTVCINLYRTKVTFAVMQVKV